MEKLLKFFETYKKYYKKGEQYTNGHLKFKDTITKEQKMQLIKKDEIPPFSFVFDDDTYTCSFSLYENAGYLHFKMICLKNGKKVNGRTFMAKVKALLAENGYLDKEKEPYNKKNLKNVI